MPVSKVLVVDDSKAELMFLRELLQKQGYAVRTAENADDALRQLAQDRPDLVLMDVVMPGQNGFQLTRTITRAGRPPLPGQAVPRGGVARPGAPLRRR